jgi:hypothetical protein
MRGYTFYSVALLGFSCMVSAQTSYNEYDYLTEKMIDLNIQPSVKPPSGFMVFLRKLSIIPLIFFKGYRYIWTKIYAISEYVKRQRMMFRHRR